MATQKIKCFVIMPFGNKNSNAKVAKQFELIYSQWIKPTVESINVEGSKFIRLECHRADKELRPGDIIGQIVEELVDSHIVIADLTGRNPNVFYELGVRHAVSNNTILIAQDIEDIPFDIRGLRTIPYKYEPEQLLDFTKKLNQAIIKILSSPEKIDNPVRQFLYNREVQKLVATPSLPGLDTVKGIINEIAAVKDDLSRQVSEVRKIMHSVTSKDVSSYYSKIADEKIIQLFEGVWRNQDTDSLYCIRFADGELRIPYCYSGTTQLTGHYYNCRVVEGTLFARYKWFNRPISGYAFYRIEDENRLVGGWWYEEDVPQADSLRDIGILERYPGMTKSVWLREKGSQRFPNWAEDYFKRKLYLEQNNKDSL